MLPSRVSAQDGATDAGKRKVRTRVTPEYPALAKQMNVTGKVKIEATIAADGHVVATRIVGGSPLLVNAALDALEEVALRTGSERNHGNRRIRFSGQEVAAARDGAQVRSDQQGSGGFCKMTIGKKLYWGFGVILAIILFLFVINIFTVMRQYSTRSAVASTLADVQTIENVRYKMIENRLSLGNYLLSGDLRDEEKTNKGITELQELLKTRRNQGQRRRAPLRALSGRRQRARLGRKFREGDDRQAAFRWIPATPPSPTCRFSTCSTIRPPGSTAPRRFWTMPAAP